ncbi:hypothetical protein H0W80_02740 [Candidatus Saccharibacteria bacterium]|nr:hypothetical protein [Candidatus Saccharibacteria bacterium]
MCVNISQMTKLYTNPSLQAVEVPDITTQHAKNNSKFNNITHMPLE